MSEWGFGDHDYMLESCSECFSQAGSVVDTVSGYSTQSSKVLPPVPSTLSSFWTKDNWLTTGTYNLVHG